MNISKAIEVLARDVRVLCEGHSTKYDDAVQLGIEALKREKFNRDNPKYIICGRLPGETEE